MCEGNWQQATSQPELLAELVAKEAREGWIFSVPDMAAARERWGERVAIGKCNIVGMTQVVNPASSSTRRCRGQIHP